MIGLLRKMLDAINHFQRKSLWEEIEPRLKRTAGLNLGALVVVAVVLLVVNEWVLPVDLKAFGIVLVALGAGKLALISARIHVNNFYERTHTTDAVERDLTTNAVPRYAARALNALVGFVLVAVGFGIRVYAELAGAGVGG